MKKTRRRFDADFKATVALEALKGKETLQQLGQRFELHPIQIASWKQILVKNSASLFDSNHPKTELTPDILELHKKIDVLEKEKEILKEKINLLRTKMDFRSLLERNGKLSVRKQCELLDINRSSVYYKSKRTADGKS